MKITSLMSGEVRGLQVSQSFWGKDLLADKLTNRVYQEAQFKAFFNVIKRTTEILVYHSVTLISIAVFEYQE